MLADSLARIWHVTIGELLTALRTRRAAVVLALYLVSSVFCMIGTINLFSSLEKEVAGLLQIPVSEQTGSVSNALWKSPAFNRIVKSAVSDPSIFENISKRHPIELAYAWFAFLCAPLLAVLSAGGRISEEMSSRSARFALLRVERVEWSLGKFFGQCMLNATALAASAIAAWAVSAIMLKGCDLASLFVAMCEWGVKVWIYSFAWLGLASGISHMTNSGSRAVCMGIVATAVFFALPPLLGLFAHLAEFPALENLDMLLPTAAKGTLWRGGAVSLCAAIVHFGALGTLYLSLGHLFLARRDI